VVDLAEGHVAALNHIFGSKEPYCDPINLGTGTGTSVLDMIKVRARDCAVRGCCFAARRMALRLSRPWTNRRDS
jgi:UDP-glucose 4-epimerase